MWPCSLTRARASLFLRFLDHTQRCTTVGRTPVGEWSACNRDICLTTRNTYNRYTCMLPAGFEPTISAGERPQTYALDSAATWTGYIFNIARLIKGHRCMSVAPKVLRILQWKIRMCVESEKNFNWWREVMVAKQRQKVKCHWRVGTLSLLVLFWKDCLSNATKHRSLQSRHFRTPISCNKSQRHAVRQFDFAVNGKESPKLCCEFH